MARKIFGIDVPPVEEATSPAPKQMIGSTSSLRQGLRELSANSIRDLDPNLIVPDGPQDRLTLDDGTLEELADSIRAHGQQVPIMVRPLEGDPARYRVVYGRRRLEAVRRLGIPVKAIVRSLDDEQAVLAQGQENNLRLDPSFIEKALFVVALEAAGYGPAVIEDAIGVDRKLAYKYRRVVSRIPETLIRLIGAAHDVGRPRWEKLAEHVVALGDEAEPLIARAVADRPESNDRFMAALSALQDAHRKPRVARPAPQVQAVTGADGELIGSVTRSQSGTVLEVQASSQPAFGQWLAEQGADALLSLYARWKEDGA